MEMDRNIDERKKEKLWQWGGERPSAKEEKRTVRMMKQTLKDQLEEKKKKQALQTCLLIGAGGVKKKKGEEPERGVYRVLCGVSLQDTPDLISDVVSELPAGILVEAVSIEPEPRIARLIDGGNAIIGSRQHWRACVSGLDGHGWCTINNSKSKNLVHVVGLNKEEVLEIYSLEDDLVGLHQRRLGLQPVLKRRAQVASHRANALNAVADRLEELDNVIEGAKWHPMRKKKLEREAVHLERKAKVIAESQQILGPKDSRRLEEIEMIMEEKQERLRLLRMIEQRGKEEREAARVREEEERKLREAEDKKEKEEEVETERAEEARRMAASSRFPAVAGGGGSAQHMMLRRRGGAPPGVSAAGLLPSLVGGVPSPVGPGGLSIGEDSGGPSGALRDRRRAGISPMMMSAPPIPDGGGGGGGMEGAGGFSMMGMGAAVGAARVLRRNKKGGIVDENAKAEEAMHNRLEKAIAVARSYGPDRFDEVLAKELQKEGQKQSSMANEVAQAAMVERLKRFGKPNHALATEGLPDDVESWDTTQVIKWGKSLGLGKRAHVLAARDVDGYAMMWMAPESIVSLLCEGASENKKKSTVAALEQLRKDNTLAKAESVAAREGKRFERLLARAVTFRVVDENAAEKIGANVRNGEESRSHYVSVLSKKLQKYRYELS